jgi:O-succinylbenzoate synthase
MEAEFKKYTLNFKEPGGTSRGVLHTKDTWLLKLKDGPSIGYGECSLFKGLSADDRPEYQDKLKWLAHNVNETPSSVLKELEEFPSIQFGYETALSSLRSENPFQIFPSKFSKGLDSIPINGLVWMGSIGFMKKQIREKIDSGFNCIKLKIGALEFSEELNLLASIRKDYSKNDLELRVDANGAFAPQEALDKLKRLADFGLHSIEQPIKAGQWEQMAELCASSPLDIALDEELIGIFNPELKYKLLQRIRPNYIILKPALVGGFKGSEEWIDLAESLNIGWWITSALESNIGLNAIAQWTYELNTKAIQGLGTGSLFSNNFDSPLIVSQGKLHYQPELDWELNF